MFRNEGASASHMCMCVCCVVCVCMCVCLGGRGAVSTIAKFKSNKRASKFLWLYAFFILLVCPCSSPFLTSFPSSHPPAFPFAFFFSLLLCLPFFFNCLTSSCRAKHPASPFERVFACNVCATPLPAPAFRLSVCLSTRLSVCPSVCPSVPSVWLTFRRRWLCHLCRIRMQTLPFHLRLSMPIGAHPKKKVTPRRQHPLPCPSTLFNPASACALCRVQTALWKNVKCGMCNF